MNKLPFGVDNPFVGVSQQWAMELAVTALPDNAEHRAMRVFFLALGSSRMNGHASFGTGEMAKQLDLPPNRLSEAIALAKKLKLIDPKSSARCLRPAWGIAGGLGEQDDPCWYCHGRRANRKFKTRQKAAEKPFDAAVVDFHTFTSGADEMQPRDSTDPTTVPMEANMANDCVGCRIVGDACHIHGSHWNKLRNLSAHDVDRLRPEMVRA